MKNYLKNGGLIALGSVAGITGAYAAIPAAVTTALSDATIDVSILGGGVLVLTITMAAFIWMKRPLH